RVFRGQFVLFNQVFDHYFGLVYVVAVADADGHVRRTGFVIDHVGHTGVGQVEAEDDEAAVINGIDDVVENADFTHGAQESLGSDGITHFERLEDHDQYPAGKVAEAALQCQANGQAGGTDNGDEGGGGNADPRRD